MLEITNLTKIKIDVKHLQKVAQAAFAVLGKKGLEDMSLVFVCDARMKGINKKFRGRNKTTDVLSFEGLNEIFICLPHARRQAKAGQPAFQKELMRLLIHGIVHLKGYDHEKSAKEAERMFSIEKKILDKINEKE